MTNSIRFKKQFVRLPNIINCEVSDITNIDFLKKLQEEVGQVTFSLITADGCVDHDTVISKTEECNLDLIRCEINTILTMQQDKVIVF